MAWPARASRVIESLLELAWLFTILAVPIYFNVNDVRAFEPDKAYLLRDCAALIAVLALLALALRLPRPMPRLPDPGRGRAGLPAIGHAAWGVCRRRPTLLPMLALASVVLLATAASILTSLSWYGSYARAQGALTTLAYLTIGLAILGFLRRLGQLERLSVAVALCGVAPAAYGWIQHFGADPLAWQQADLAARVPGSMGNPIFLGALLVMTLPLAAYRLLRLLWPDGPGSVGGCSVRQLPAVLGWAGVILLEGGALVFTKSRGPFAGLLAEIPIFALALSRAWELPWLRRLALGIVACALAALLSVNLLGSAVFGRISDGSAIRLLQWSPSTSGSSEVRLDIWGPALELIPKRPLLGCGPDVLNFCYYPVYPTALRHIEAPNAMPDRTHNMFLDAAVETGLLGLLALLALLSTAAVVLDRLTTGATDPRGRLLAAALLAALAGHGVEGFFGIEIVATHLLVWCICGAAGAMAVMAAGARVKPSGAVIWTDGPQHSPASMPATLVRGGTTAGRQRAAATKQSPVRGRLGANASLFRRLATALGICALLGALLGAWHVVRLGASATAADDMAAKAAGLEQAAMGNSGQATVPAGVHPDAILALRQFAAAAALRNQAIADQPVQEEYLLDAGTTEVNWAQAAANVGGTAATQAQDLFVQALVDFGRAARLNPYNPDHFRNTGKAYERWAGLGHDAAQPATWNQTLLQRAADAFAHAAQLAPHHPDPLTSWAEVALWQGRPSQALALANRALALDVRDGDAFRLRARAEIRLNRRQAALADWRQALVDPRVAHRGDTAASLALAEATWAQERCLAVTDARAALAAGSISLSDTTTMHEIVHVDASACLAR